jgi:hypothetical protein
MDGLCIEIKPLLTYGASKHHGVLKSVISALHDAHARARCRPMLLRSCRQVAAWLP